jgi:class 3 adenylate cyclase/tetratricopeptide (TPR) repeat protein
MQCPKCQFENRENAKFCGECGYRFEATCPECGAKNRAENKFCDECGYNFKTHKETTAEILEEESLPLPTTAEKSPRVLSPVIGERKHVTALFSDLSGYTTMSERLDPEEIKEITGKIFDEVSKIISKYEGFVEKFAGDAVMALFGATEAHEDDPVRAIKAAREIHNRVNSLSPQYEERIEQPLVMHSGINTGLVVTGDIDLEKGTHGVAGDTINVAARLSSLGMADDILVGPDTYYQSEGYFDFKELEPAAVKGKSKPIRIYKVIAQKEQPIKIHRLHGFQAELIGRTVEMNQLAGATRKLKEGAGTIFSIYGPAGTGKSRLVKEFKESLNLDEIQWLEGHAYPHSQNIPYSSLIDLLNRSLQIEEGDLPERVKEKIESGISSLVGENTDFIPYIGSLYSLSYPEIDEVSPAFWKEQLQKAIQAILSSLAQQAPTIIRLEDLHWADPSFLELIRLLLLESRDPILFLCVYRPVISLFTSHQVNAMSNPYREIRLNDLSASESQGMIASLLQTDKIPSKLQHFLQDKVEGNPFYLEEIINSLIESDTLIRDNGDWKLTKEITESEISSTIHGVISGRLDRLEKESKRILQEASVIGRTFFYEILNRITELEQQIDQSLRSLERLDLIRARALQPDLEYIFKHALTQEVVYNGLLKKERRAIHERIGQVMEQLFHDRLPEFYETLAFHFKQGESILKAVEYLMKSAEKSVRRYAVEEAHQYYKEAFDILSNKPDKSRKDEQLIIDLIIKWSLVFYHRGDWGGLDKVLSANIDLAESIDDKARLGMFYAWHGFIIAGARGKLRDSYQYLTRALELGETIGNQQIIGYACTWLNWACSDLGLLDEAIIFGERAQEIAKIQELDHYLFFKSLAGLGQTYWFKGESKKNYEIGRILLDYGKKHSNIRSLVVGHVYTGCGNLAAGNFTLAVECFKRAVEAAADPFYSHWGRIFLGTTYVLIGQFREAEETLREIVSYCENYSCEYIRPFACGFFGIVMIEKGQWSQGLKMIEEARQSSMENERKAVHALMEYILGKVYLQIVQGEGSKSLSFLAKNIGFLMKNVPFASQKAETHFNKAIEVAKEIGANGIQAQAYLDLGLLHRAKKRDALAKKCISDAIKIFEECEAKGYLEKAKEIIASLS